MTDTAVESPPPGGPAHRRAGMTTADKVRFALRGIGQTLITLGCVVLLFVVYEVWITNIFAAHQQSKVASALKQEWQKGKDPLLPLPGSGDPSIPVGQGIAVLYIPRLGRDYHFTVVQGDVTPNDAQLEEGPAHYKNTALPGQVGNFAVAGHRVGKGEPFLNLDKLQSGDAVIVETKTEWYVYRVLGKPAGGNPQKEHEDVRVAGGGTVSLPGREIVDPADPTVGRVLAPVPDNVQDGAAVALMTMTTCHPKFTASHRMIVYSRLQTKLANTNLKMPASVLALYDEVKA
jgi:sortase A